MWELIKYIYEQIQLQELLLELKSKGTAVIFTSHEPEYIYALADSLYVLKDGMLSYAAAPGQMSREQLSACILEKLYHKL